MRNNSSIQVRRSIPRRTIPSPALLLALLLAFSSTAVLAQQCLDQNDPNSLACQMQQPVNTSAPTGESQAWLGPSGQQQQQPRPDRSSDASASGSLSNGENYTGQPNGQHSPENRMNQLPGAELSLHPEPPTEFQKFVAATTGQMLPVYGAELFSDRRATFGPILDAPAPADLLIAAGDQLRIRIWGQVNFSANLPVSRAGEIYLPKVGAVHVAGLTLAQAQDHLHQELDRIYRNFELSADLGEIHSIQIYVTGKARRPGEYTVSALSTLVDAVFSSGGPSNAGSMRHIELRRNGKTIADFDLYALLVKGDKTGDTQLQPGDVLFIPPTGPQVALLGSVRQPGIYELRGEPRGWEPADGMTGERPGATLGAAIAAAGGRTAISGGTRISVDRIEDHARRRTIELTADDAGLSSALADGDIVRIDPIESAFRDTVTLRGSVANPGRYRWHAGMRLSDLLPGRDALLTRGYWWRRTQLGFPAPEFAGSTGKPSGASPSGNNQGNQAAEPASDNQAPASGFTIGDESPQPSAQTEMPAAMLSPGLQTDWKYAVIERLDPETMTTSLISFDLGKLVLDHDLSEDRELRPGDVVTIFSQDDVHTPVDQRTKYVQLDGEIVNAGVYSVRPGETLRALVIRAGGLTSKAYLYGAEFTRKSTQATEQQSMNEYADRLEHNIDRSALALSEQEGAGGPDAFNPARSINRSLVARLRQLRAEGRVVLNVSPQSSTAADLPDIPLEDGDRLIVPPTPSTIQVIGAVFNQNAFLYRRDARAGEYLRYAGGPTHEADRGQTFILRADGSVFSRGEKQSVFASGTFQNARLYPGDTVVVPEKMVRPSALREVAEWTQLMSQLSISAAAVDVIK